MDHVPSYATLSLLFSLVAYIPYVIATWKSNVKLTISTWISWGLMDIAIFAGMIASNEIAWQMAAYIFGATLMISVSLYKGASVGWTKTDTAFLAVVVVAIIGWALTGNPEVAIALSLVAISAGTAPMLINTWRNPENEPLLPWILFWIGGLAGMLAITSWTIAGAATQILFWVVHNAFIILILRKYLRSGNNKLLDQILMRD